MNKGYDYANQERKVRNSSETIFRIGSVTKPFTTVLIMRLVEQGKIDLAAPVSTYLPELDKRMYQVTVKQLLQQTSGIADYTETPLTCSAFQQRPIEPLKFVACFNELKLDFIPGSKFSYSNSNYYLLGALLEKITGQSFEQNLQKQILQPLKITHTGYQAATTPNFAQGYTSTDGKIVPANIKDISRAYTAGGMFSTVEDLYRFEQALRGESLLKKATLEQVFAENKAVEPSYYGFGWYVGPDSSSQDYRTFHEGGIAGFSSCVDRYLKNGLCIIVLSNFEFTESRVDVTEPLTKLILSK